MEEKRVSRSPLIGGVAVVCLMTGCAAGAATAPAPDIATSSEVTPLAERYAAALTSALDLYEADVAEAVDRWYPSYTVSYATSLEYIDVPLDPYVEAACAAHRVSREEVTAYARENPAWMRTQNAVYRERMGRIRREAFAIMGRIDPEVGAAGVDVMEVAPLVPETSEQVASR